MYMNNAVEPIGAEAAIGWHLRQVDYHDNNASMADACDMPECAQFHDKERLKHTARLAVLEDRFPLTAIEVRKQIAAEVAIRELG